LKITFCLFFLFFSFCFFSFFFFCVVCFWWVFFFFDFIGPTVQEAGLLSLSSPPPNSPGTLLLYFDSFFFAPVLSVLIPMVPHPPLFPPKASIPEPVTWTLTSPLAVPRHSPGCWGVPPPIFVQNPCLIALLIGSCPSPPPPKGLCGDGF